MKHKKFWIVAFLLPAILLFIFIYAVPLGIVIFTSLFNYRAFPQAFEFVGLQQYVKLFQDPVFRVALSNTLIWILVHCTLHIGIGVLMAMLLYRKPFGWKFTRVAYMVPSIIPNAAMATIFLNFYNPRYGLVNSVLRAIGHPEAQTNWLANPQTAFVSVTVIWTLFAGYTTTLVLAEALSINEDVIEAAKVDGASGFKLDFHIVLPLVRKMIGTTVIMAATYMLQLFDIVYITTGGGPGRVTSNLPLMLYQTMMNENNYGYANAVGVVIIVLGIIFMNLINRIFRMNEQDI